MRHAIVVALLLIATGTAVAIEASPRTLTFEDRVKAQAAIERVYYSHQIGTSKPFEQAVPGSVLEAKVHRYLDETAALQVHWKTEVTDEMLQRELERMAQGTRMPERLLELYSALGNDFFVIKECLARATLVDRLARDLYSVDDFHIVANTILNDGWSKSRIPLRSGTTAEVSADRGLLGKPAGTLPIGTSRLGAGGVVCTGSNSWTSTSVTGEPSSRTFHTAVWTGSVMIVWGGRGDGGAALNTGGRYNPTTDSWTPTSTNGVPSARTGHAAVWTGNRMIVWGGNANGGLLNSGGRYDPAIRA